MFYGTARHLLIEKDNFKKNNKNLSPLMFSDETNVFQLVSGVVSLVVVLLLFGC